MPSNLCPGDILQIYFGFLSTHSQSKTITYEPAHKITVHIFWASPLLCKRLKVFMIPRTFQKLNLLLIFTFYIMVKYQFSPNLAGFPDILN